ncbi:hypothetical protein Tco_0548474 [Tanacetum coccineum]
MFLCLPRHTCYEKTLTQYFGPKPVNEEFLLGSVFLLELLDVAIGSSSFCTFRAEEMPSLISCRMASKVMTGVQMMTFFWRAILSTLMIRSKNDIVMIKTGKYDANGGRKMMMNAEISIKNYRGLNSSDGGNIGDRVKNSWWEQLGYVMNRIIREQRIAAYNGYRGGGVVQVLKGA